MQTAFVPKTHADAGLFFLLQPADLSREWQRDIVVVQLDVKESIRSRGSSNGLQGNEITRCEFVFDGVDCCNLEWKLHESTFGNGSVEQSLNEQWLASRGARISGHLHNDHGIGVARFDKKKRWKFRKLAWSLDDFVLAAICHADAASVAASEVMVAEVIAKLTEVGLSVGSQKTHSTSHTKMVDKSIMVDELVVLGRWSWNLLDRRCV